MDPETKTASDTDKEAQEKRSETYSIGIKDGGNITKPSEWKTVPDAEFADPVNYRGPMPDKAHADNAAARWADHADGSWWSEYTTDEQDIITKRIEDRQADFGEDDNGDADKAAPQHGKLEYKTIGFRVRRKDAKSTDLQEGEFEGYGAAFGNVDACGDIIEKGAFAAGLADFLANGTICWQHDWSEPIGKPLDAKEDDQGLYIKSRISQTTRGKDALTLLRDDVVRKLSIGYEVQAYKVLSDEEGRALLGDQAYDAALRDLPWWMDGVRVLTQIKLYEISLVTVPANENATITGVKENPLTGQTLDSHFQGVLAAHGELLTRVKAVAELRAKSGRVLSAANQSKLQEMRDSLADHLQTLDDLLASATPNDPDNDNDIPSNEPDHDGMKSPDLTEMVRKEVLRFQRTVAHINGVN